MTAAVTLQPISELEVRILWLLFEAKARLHISDIWFLCGGEASPVVSAANLLHQKGLIDNYGFICALNHAGRMALLSLICAGKCRELADGSVDCLKCSKPIPYQQGTCLHCGYVEFRIAGCAQVDSNGAGAHPSNLAPPNIAGRAEAGSPTPSLPTAITPAYSTGTAPQAGSVPVISEQLADAYDDGHARGAWSREIHLVNPSRRAPVKFHAPEACDCGNPMARRCQCGKPICLRHGYLADSNDPSSPVLCAECSANVEMERAAETIYGKADAR